ncbi:polysaccharide pyruvyl transferase family protein [Butyrivibrio sp. JL13D10]|uniref:polysaccharide pyruvyl transferase family protein n=1 Tax=Butyrivibrio sp. JL13D10 TaxID=3236815 RepID=UPI0038B4DB02
MKKILLITLQSDNIGNRLQNYALQETLKSMGCEVWTPYMEVPEWNTIKKRIKNCMRAVLYKVGRQNYKNAYFRLRRICKYASFNRKYIDHLFKLRYQDAFKKKYDDFKFAVVGSDQVWHKWTDNKSELDYYYLKFVQEEKRISYAPSFGFEDIPMDDKAIHINGLLGMKALSCRELSARDIIKRYTGRDAKLVLDPTLLIDKESWLRLEKKSGLYKNKPYILIYYLGTKDDEYLRIINEVAVNNNLDIIDAFDAGNLESFLTTPDEFIWLVHNAEYICTDSFHATVFSIIFEKKFLTFKRKEIGMEEMFGRIETLLSFVGLEERIYSGDIAQLYKEYVNKSINGLQKDSYNYLKNAIS